MKLIDLHCDTITEDFNRGEPFLRGSGHISLDKAAAIRDWCQVMAVWSDRRYSDEECWQRFLRVTDDLQSQLPTLPVDLCRSAGAITAAWQKGRRAVVLAVEGGRLLNNDLSRLDVLYERGVRFLTLVWSDVSCIGGGGHFEEGITDFGRQVVRRCFELGIVPDLSHGSRKLTEEVLEMAEAAGKPVMCTHSDSFAVRQHERNISDDTYRRIAALGGVVGVCIYPQHLVETEPAHISDVIAHVQRYRSLDPHAVAIGTDFDGMDVTPVEIPDVSGMPALRAALLDEGLTEAEADDVLFGNALRFMERTLNA